MSDAHSRHETLLVLVKSERKITSDILEQLNQMNQHRHWAKLGFASLFEYCTKALGYSESQAYRRISAMKLLSALPEVRQKIENAELNLSTLAQAQSFIQKEERLNHCRFSPEEKSKIIKRVELKTQREAELSLVEIASEPGLIKSHEGLRAISKNQSQLQVNLSHETLSELDEIKSELSHCLKTASYSEIISYLSKDFLKVRKSRRTKALRKKNHQSDLSENHRSQASSHLRSDVTLQQRSHAYSKLKSEASSQQSASSKHGSGASSLRRNVAAESFLVNPQKSGSDANVSQVLEPQSLKPQTLKPQSLASKTFATAPGTRRSLNRLTNRPRLTARAKRQIWARDQGQCTYKDPVTGRNCSSRFRLEIDHKIPRSLGGSDQIFNLRLLCRAHNQQQALEKLGPKVMEPYARGN